MRQLQYMLQVLSSVIPAIPPVEVDGIFGPATRASVLAAQRYFGLPQSGAVDEQTWLRLESQFRSIDNNLFRNQGAVPLCAGGEGPLPRLPLPRRSTGASRGPRTGTSRNEPPARAGGPVFPDHPHDTISRCRAQHGPAGRSAGGGDRKMIAEPSYYVGRPVESMQTMLRFAAEGNNRLLPVVPDGVFGPNTMAAVTAFQRYYGLPATGVMNGATWERLVQTYQAQLVQQAPAEAMQPILNPSRR